MKTLLALGFAGLSVLSSSALAADLSVSIPGVRIQSGGTTISIGERDRRGYYWDGRTWRDPVYWEKNHGKAQPPAGQGPAQGRGHHCPPGQAKKGNC
ncbi:MAG TPA: DUF2502 domain-containing protein [Accumulibacter sp.]|uniref:DUF2502 domain-containing protein n=1 Tax=Accumulibacter sp. TaxID=2053492 RepID=UPI0028789EE5|nr:DUF2502 domain-containing protein [Accumulibacter sp.]MDS4054776.1 DUF2502 domain-containing protein [Accumulibacter sp.]HMV04594.1 DUF2502 domain-containing protein [Accumulibacter sp.]HMW62997.1 DUF2502 domain-containing protein [Accumulibacter sp.]HMW81358.1 DUF2502 domain-containing protein [Accumulibacter sp.]HMX69893.1 DUF2502 domain-containing protein [Accumulibacter sp.]